MTADQDGLGREPLQLRKLDLRRVELAAGQNASVSGPLRLGR